MLWMSVPARDASIRRPGAASPACVRAWGAVAPGRGVTTPGGVRPGVGFRAPTWKMRTSGSGARNRASSCCCASVCQGSARPISMSLSESTTLDCPARSHTLPTYTSCTKIDWPLLSARSVNGPPADHPEHVCLAFGMAWVAYAYRRCRHATAILPLELDLVSRRQVKAKGIGAPGFRSSSAIRQSPSPVAVVLPAATVPFVASNSVTATCSQHAPKSSGVSRALQHSFSCLAMSFDYVCDPSACSPLTLERQSPARQH